VKKLIGCFSPDEWQLDKKALKKVYNNKNYDWKKWTILSFRMPPFRLFKDSSIDVVLSKILDQLPIIKNIGTTIFYEIIKRKNDETV